MNEQEKTVSFTSLGCPKNLVDSEVMVGMLMGSGFSVNPAGVEGRVAVINTCAFVEQSKQESIDAILALAEKKRRGECDMIVVTGCLSQRYAGELPELLPEVDLFVGTGEYHRLPELIARKLAGETARTHVDKPVFVPDHLTPRAQSTAFYTRYVKVSEGCSHRCSFCIIPTLRGGKARSRPVDSIVTEVRAGVSRGVREFNLVAQDLNEYGRDLPGRPSLHQLLLALQEVEGDYWLRLLYMYPLQFPDRLVESIARHPNVVKYVDIPLQHIADPVLKLMKRGSSSRYIHRLLANLRRAMPEITLRTTLIVGHPGETHEDFDTLKKFVAETGFDNLGVFAYSPEEGTPSFDMSAVVPDEVKRERLHEIMTLQKAISRRKNERLVGRRLRVLCEGVHAETEFLLQGRHAGQAPGIDGQVLIRAGQGTVGEFCDVTIVKAHDYDLVGEITFDA